MDNEIVYRASKTGSKLIKSRKFVSAIMGPVGSGKSVACVIKLFTLAMEQAPNQHGIRRTKWVIIRNSYRELLDTSMETFFEWIPKEWGEMSIVNASFFLSQVLPDGTTVEAEFLFRALERPADIKKLLSLDATGIWLNEARELPKAVFDIACTRVGRFPPMKEGGPSWHGIILDSNPPDSDSWWYKLFEEDLPEEWDYWKQPSGLSPEAENVENLPKGYYDNLQIGKQAEWIKVYVHGGYGFTSDGKPVWPEYNDDVHFWDVDYQPIKNKVIHIGLDFGLTPGAAFGQYENGELIIFDELVTFNMGATNFTKLLKEKMATKYPGFEFEVTGDPAGDQRAQTDEQTPFMVLAEGGIIAYPAYTNDFIIRRDTLGELMLRLSMTGKPAFRVTRGAPTLRKALAGGYAYKRVQVAGAEQFRDVPNKNKFSHVADAAQYLALGCTGGDIVFAKSKTVIKQPQTGII